MQRGSVNTVKVLLEAGARIDIKNDVSRREIRPARLFYHAGAAVAPHLRWRRFSHRNDSPRRVRACLQEGLTAVEMAERSVDEGEEHRLTAQAFIAHANSPARI